MSESFEYIPNPSYPDIAVIGGGNGTSMIIEGLRQHDVNITAIPTTFDNGGSTGDLRKEYPGLIGIGDIRQCMRALSGSSLAEILDDRSPEGHALGNLLLVRTAVMLGGVHKIEEAIEAWRAPFEMSGFIIPVSKDSSHLRLTDLTNSISAPIIGERQAAESEGLLSDCFLDLDPPVTANPRALKALHESDAVIIAPGNPTGSIIPPLLIPEIQKAIRSIQKAGKNVIMVCNLSNDHKTDNFALSGHVSALRLHTGITPDIVIAHEGENDLIEKPIAIENIRPIVRLLGDLAMEAECKYDPRDAIADTRALVKHNGPVVGDMIMRYLSEQ